CELREEVEAPKSPAGVEWPEPADLHPENPHLPSLARQQVPWRDFTACSNGRRSRLGIVGSAVATGPRCKRRAPHGSESMEHGNTSGGCGGAHGGHATSQAPRTPHAVWTSGPACGVARSRHSGTGRSVAGLCRGMKLRSLGLVSLLLALVHCA